MSGDCGELHSSDNAKGRGVGWERSVIGTRASVRHTKGLGKYGVGASYASRERPMSSPSRAVTICGVLVAVALTPADGAAQNTSIDSSGLSALVRVGAHLRVRGQGIHSSVFRGRLRAMSNDSIRLALDDDPEETLPFAVADLGRVEVERDEKSREQAATVMGALGAVGGVTAAVLWCKHNQSDCQDDIDRTIEAAQNDSSYVGTSMLMILGGTAVGALLGYALAPPPHWELMVFPIRTSRSDGHPSMLLNVGVRYSLNGRWR